MVTQIIRFFLWIQFSCEMKNGQGFQGKRKDDELERKLHYFHAFFIRPFSILETVEIQRIIQSSITPSKEGGFRICRHKEFPARFINKFTSVRVPLLSYQCAITQAGPSISNFSILVTDTRSGKKSTNAYADAAIIDSVNTNQKIGPLVQTELWRRKKKYKE